MWLRVRVLKSRVFRFSTAVRAIRDSLRDAVQVCSANLRISGMAFGIAGDTTVTGKRTRHANR